jgi:RNA polymerase sigma-32 factor
MASTATPTEDPWLRGLVRGAMAAPMLTREREIALARRWRDRRDQAALQELVSSHLRLVVSQARKYRGYGLSFGDLLQEGNLGLMEAASRFDPDRGFRLATYAVWWIRAALSDYVLRNWSIVRLGTTSADKTLFFKLRGLRARAELAQGGLDYDARRQMADALGTDVASLERMEMRLARVDPSLDAPAAKDDSSSRQERLVDDRPSPETIVMERHDSTHRARWLRRALECLPRREAMILRERHQREDGATLDELGRRLGISKERVRQLEQRALGALRDQAARVPEGAI